MHVLAEVMKRHGEEVEVLSCVLQLQSQLAFEKKNILTIVQYGGIDGIMKVIRDNMDKKQLVIMCLTLLDNIFLGSQEYAAVAWEQVRIYCVLRCVLTLIFVIAGLFR